MFKEEPVVDHHATLEKAVNTNPPINEALPDHEKKYSVDTLITAYATFAQDLDALVDKIPSWIPVLGPLFHSKLAELKSSIALGLGVDPKDPTKKLENWSDRLSTAGGYLGESLLGQIQSLYEVLALVGTGGGSIATEAAKGGAGAASTLELTKLLGKLGSKEGGTQALIDLLPEVFKKLAQKAPNEAVQKGSLDALRAVTAFIKNEKARESIAAWVDGQAWWQEFQKSIQNGSASADEVQAKIAEVQEKIAKETPLADQLFNQKTTTTPS